METFVAGDELVGKGKTSHETALLEPEDRCKGPREEDTLDGGESHETLGEGGLFVLNPPNGPVGLLLDTRNSFDGIEEISTLGLLLNIRVDEERVCLGVDVFDHDLEPIEATGFWDLNLTTETLKQVLVY